MLIGAYYLLITYKYGWGFNALEISKKVLTNLTTS